MRRETTITRMMLQEEQRKSKNRETRMLKIRNK
jgi:hypothetical protein